jgi:methionyl-tRNA formyltransferase
MARLVYLGTPALSVPPLQALVAAGHEVSLVVSRPDRRRGRGGAMSPSPLKEAAQRLGLKVTDTLAEVVDTQASLGVVVAYGRLVPPAILAAVPMINVHFSLLPRWRGAAPVERAILAGDRRTGVTVMGLEEGLDTGPVYAMSDTEIGEDEHAEELGARLSLLGAQMLVEILAQGIEGLPDARAQAGEPLYAEKLRPEEFELQWTQGALDLARVVRLGRAWTTYQGRRLRILRARPADPALGADPALPGTFTAAGVATGEGWLAITKVQPESGRPMAYADWLRGVRADPGARFDTH